MFYYAKFNYSRVHWDQPVLSHAEQLQVGEQIYKLGRSAYRKKCWENKNAFERNYTARERTWRWVLGILLVAGFVALLVFFAPAAIGLLVVICAFKGLTYYGSYASAILKFNKWSQKCLNVYLGKDSGTDEANWVQKEIIKCPKCSKNLRIPSIGGRLKVKCPECGLSFHHPVVGCT